MHLLWRRRICETEKACCFGDLIYVFFAIGDLIYVLINSLFTTTTYNVLIHLVPPLRPTFLDIQYVVM